MLPVQIIGLALAGRALLEKYAGASPDGSRTTTPINSLTTNFTNNIYYLRKQLSAVNPLNSLARTLEPAISRLKKFAFGDGQASDDYEDIVERFMPENATLLAPERPSYTKELHLTDLDGDSAKELIASFRLKDEIKTIILKKGNDGWYKASEISSPGFMNLNYRDVVNISGTGKRHLLLGLSSRDKPSTVCGYTMENDEVHETFSYNYNKFDVLRKSEERSSQADIAIWNKQNDGTYDISICRWNGIEFEPVAGNYSSYYRKKAVPYLAMKAKYAPYSAANWYNLAEALVKAGDHSDALIAINVGIDMDRNATFRDRFLTLRSELG
jgi:hypothetical protein